MNSAEQWRHECEVRLVAAMPSADLKSFMEGVKKARSAAMYTKLRTDVLAARKTVAEPEQKSLL